MTMTPEQIDAYLSEPRIADLATINPDGSPHIAPVWYRYDGETLKVFSQHTAVKLRNIRHDPRVALSIATHSEPYGYVIVSGAAAISDEGIPDEARQMAIHYKGAEGEAYIREALAQFTFRLITITPTKMSGWME